MTYGSLMPTLTSPVHPFISMTSRARIDTNRPWEEGRHSQIRRQYSRNIVLLETIARYHKLHQAHNCPLGSVYEPVCAGAFRFDPVV